MAAFSEFAEEGDFSVNETAVESTLVSDFNSGRVFCTASGGEEAS